MEGGLSKPVHAVSTHVSGRALSQRRGRVTDSRLAVVLAWPGRRVGPATTKLARGNTYFYHVWSDSERKYLGGGEHQTVNKLFCMLVTNSQVCNLFIVLGIMSTS
jgi:hypothetical protein